MRKMGGQGSEGGGILVCACVLRGQRALGFVWVWMQVSDSVCASSEWIPVGACECDCGSRLAFLTSFIHRHTCRELYAQTSELMFLVLL